jgi:serine/threonine protein kinase
VPYYVTEFLPHAQPICAYARTAALGLSQRLRLFLDLCDAIVYAHKKHILHCDLKPENVLVCPGNTRHSWQLYVLDFGLARALYRGAQHANINDVFGTPAYMSPEHIAPEKFGPLTRLSDQYQLGLILFELLVGRPLYHMPQNTFLITIRKVILDAIPPPLGTLNQEYRGQLEAIVAKVLAKNPADRYDSVVSLQNALYEYLGEAEDLHARRAAWNRKRMLALVKHQWLEDMPVQSLPHLPWMTLDVEEWPEAITDRWNRVRPSPVHRRQSFVPSTAIIEQCETTGGNLLILGEPGFGKTQLLLHIAQRMMTRAESDTTFPMPVIFLLSSWSNQFPIVEWFVEELEAKYKIPRPQAQTWLANDELLLLLDEFDQVPFEQQRTCLQAIADFLEDHPRVWLVLCSRTAEYNTTNIKLKLDHAVCLQPLTLEKVAHYLNEAGPELHALGPLLATHPSLQELAISPLMLHILSTISWGKSPAELQGLLSMESGYKGLFAAYVAELYKRGGTNQPYSYEQITHWLAWLACRMADHAQSVLLIERMQPGWLSTRWHEKVITTGTLALSGLIFGLAFGVIDTMIDGLGMRVYRAAFAGLCGGLIAGLCGLGKEIQPVERQGWSWSAMPALVDGLVAGLGLGLLVGVGVALILGAIEGQAVGLAVGVIVWLFAGVFIGLTIGLKGDILPRLIPNRQVRRRLRIGLGTVLLVALTLGLVVGRHTEAASELLQGPGLWLIVGLVAGMCAWLALGVARGEIATRHTPNEGIKRSLRNALLTTAVVGSLIGLVIGQGVGRLGMWSEGLYVGLGSGAVLGLGFGLLNGGQAYIQHYTLRCLLQLNDVAPFNYVRFLNYAARRTYLYKVGGGYRFYHPLLKQYFEKLLRSSPNHLPH